MNFTLLAIQVLNKSDVGLHSLTIPLRTHWCPDPVASAVGSVAINRRRLPPAAGSLSASGGEPGCIPWSPGRPASGSPRPGNGCTLPRCWSRRRSGRWTRSAGKPRHRRVRKGVGGWGGCSCFPLHFLLLAADREHKQTLHPFQTIRQFSRDESSAKPLF